MNIKRPKNVPKDAVWMPDWKEWVLKINDSSDNEVYQCWDDEGVLVGESEGYFEGDNFVLNGYNKRFSKNGKLSSIGYYKKNSLYEISWFREEAPKMDTPFPEQMDKNIYQIKEFRDKNLMIEKHYYDKSGIELDFLGKKLPKRPKQVTKIATYNSDQNFWVDGVYNLDFNKQDGIWRWWDKNGKIMSISIFDNGNTLSTFHKKSGLIPLVKSNNLELLKLAINEKYYKNIKEAYYKAANIGNSEIVKYLKNYLDKDKSDNAENKPDNIPQDAVWFKKEQYWCSAEVNADGIAVGTWILWDYKGNQCGEIKHEENKTITIIKDPEGWIKEKEVRCGIEFEKYIYNEDNSVKEHITCDKEGITQEDSYHDNGKLFARYKKNKDGKKIYKGFWYKDGSINEETITGYDGDIITSKEEHGTDGIVTFKANLHDGIMKCIIYQNNQTPLVEGDMKDGFLTGIWKIFDLEGKVSEEIDITDCNIKSDLSRGPVYYNFGEAIFNKLIDDFEIPVQLKGVNEIEWNNSEGAYTSYVEDFPKLLVGMTMKNIFVQNYAFGQIERETLHQGSIYDSTAKVIPFLIKLLEHPNTNKKSILYTIQYYGESAFPYIAEARENADNEDYFPISGTIDAISNGWSIISKFLKSEDIEFKNLVIVIAKFVNNQKEIKTALINFLKNESDSYIKSCCIDTLCNLDDIKINELAFCLDDKDILVRSAAAIAMAFRFGQDNPDIAMDVLEEAFNNWEELSPDFDQLQYVDSHILSYISIAIGSIRSAKGLEMIPMLCKTMNELNALEVLEYSRGLLALAFGNGQLPFAPKFLEVLESIANSEKFYKYVNCNDVLDSWNLPHSAEELKEIIKTVKNSENMEKKMFDILHNGN